MQFLHTPPNAGSANACLPGASARRRERHVPRLKHEATIFCVSAPPPPPVRSWLRAPEKRGSSQFIRAPYICIVTRRRLSLMESIELYIRRPFRGLSGDAGQKAADASAPIGDFPMAVISFSTIIKGGVDTGVILYYLLAHSRFTIKVLRSCRQAAVMVCSAQVGALRNN